MPCYFPHRKDSCDLLTPFRIGGGKPVMQILKVMESKCMVIIEMIECFGLVLFRDW